MSAEDNKRLVRRITEEVISKGNLAVAAECIAPNYVYHEPNSPDLRGVEGFQQLVTTYRTAFPDLNVRIDDVIAEGDKVVTCWTATGTHRGQLQGIAPTGKQARVTGMVVSRIANGKVVEDRECYDALGMLRQLGAIPQQGQGR